MKRWAHVLLVSAMLSACASVPNTPPSNHIASTSTEGNLAAGSSSSEKTVDFFDAYTFDKQLSADLRQEPSTVDVYLKAPASINDIPERLGKWLAMVEQYGGAVEARDETDQQTRGLITGGLSLVVGAVTGLYQTIRDRALYGPVKRYNATVFYQGSDGRMTRIEFTRKAPDS